MKSLNFLILKIPKQAQKAFSFSKSKKEKAIEQGVTCSWS